MSAPIAVFDHTVNEVEPSLEFLKRTRWELRELRFVHVFKDKLHVIDVNRDYFEVRGVGYPDTDIVPLLKIVNAAYDPETIHTDTNLEYKEIKTGRRWAWAADRLM